MRGDIAGEGDEMRGSQRVSGKRRMDVDAVKLKACAEFKTESCQPAVWTMCRQPKAFLKINSTVLFGRNLKERPGGPDNF